jgi:hypothetical protein
MAPCMTFGAKDNKLHFLHVFRDRLEYPVLLKIAKYLSGNMLIRLNRL